MNDDSKAALIEHLKIGAYDGMTPEQAHQFFHTARMRTKVETKLKPMAMASFFVVLSPETIGRLVQWNNLRLFIDNVTLQDRDGVKMLIQALHIANDITPDEASRALALLEQTEEVTREVVDDAPIVRVLYGIKDPGRPNAIPLDEFTQCFKEARG